MNEKGTPFETGQVSMTDSADFARVSAHARTRNQQPGSAARVKDSGHAANDLEFEKTIKLFGKEPRDTLHYDSLTYSR